MLPDIPNLSTWGLRGSRYLKRLLVLGSILRDFGQSPAPTAAVKRNPYTPFGPPEGDLRIFLHPRHSDAHRPGYLTADFFVVVVGRGFAAFVLKQL